VTVGEKTTEGRSLPLRDDAPGGVKKKIVKVTREQHSKLEVATECREGTRGREVNKNYES